jgi:hypothetical protein
MITNFNDVEIVTRNTISYPITVDDVKAYSKYFRKTDPSDTSQDAFISKMIARVVDGWEAETGFLLLDQTFKTSLYNQEYIYHHFIGRFTRLNLRSFGDFLYHPRDWNETDAKIILSSDNYIIHSELNTTPAMFQLSSDNQYLSLYPAYNNLETEVVGGYDSNDFSSMPQEIKDALAMQVSDIIDADNDICGCDGFYSQEVKRIYCKYTIFTVNITI